MKRKRVIALACALACATLTADAFGQCFRNRAASRGCSARVARVARCSSFGQCRNYQTTNWRSCVQLVVPSACATSQGQSNVCQPCEAVESVAPCEPIEEVAPCEPCQSCEVAPKEENAQLPPAPCEPAESVAPCEPVEEVAPCEPCQGTNGYCLTCGEASPGFSCCVNSTCKSSRKRARCAPLRRSVAQTVSDLLRLINLRRRYSLQPDANLNAQAQQQANAMAACGRLFHSGNGWEICAQSYSLNGCVGLWLNSRGHRSVMLGNFARCGVGTATDAFGRVWACARFM